MKNWKLIASAFLLMFFVHSPEVEAQVVSRRTNTVVRVNRAKKRKVRRKKRRVRRRTLRRLPANTRARVWRNVSYYPVGGMYYVARRGVYARAFPPRGFRIRTVAGALTRLMVRGAVYYYSAGVFYRNVDEEYEVVAAPIGAVINELPEDAEEMDFDGITTYELNETLYKAIDDGYEVVDLMDDDE
ncbi:MAG: hypothetical protein KJO16_02675 [Muriicola sp.]|nr:hypothetical protein [Muriicola sp.]NNK10752.1 hypothetical protein [Flavobacteriaceae bacterium]